MKIQRNSVYFLLPISVVTLIMSIILNACGSMLSFATNMILNIFGGAILTLILSCIEYHITKRESLENYYKAFSRLYGIAGRFMETKDYLGWFEEYIKANADLSLACSHIAFIFDPYRHRKYLYSITNYFNDFIILTQNDFRLLKEIPDYTNSKFLEKIRTVIIKDDKITTSLTNYSGTRNIITKDLVLHNNNIYQIYEGTAHKKFVLDCSLVNESNFNVLNTKEEILVKKCIEEGKKTSVCEMTVQTSQDIVDSLMKKGYLSGFKKLNESQYKLSCQYILFSYFELKSRMRKG